MSTENLRIVEAGLDAFNNRDEEGFAALTTEDFEWRPALPGAVDIGNYVGRPGIARYFSESRDTWARLTVEHQTLRDVDGSVLVLGHAIGRGLGSGAPVRMPLAFVVEFRDGRMAKASTYLSHDQALRATGLEL